MSAGRFALTAALISGLFTFAISARLGQRSAGGHNGHRTRALWRLRLMLLRLPFPFLDYTSLLGGKAQEACPPCAGVWLASVAHRAPWAEATKAIGAVFQAFVARGAMGVGAGTPFPFVAGVLKGPRRAMRWLASSKDGHGRSFAVIVVIVTCAPAVVLSGGSEKRQCSSRT